MWYHVYINRTCYQITQDENWVRLFTIRQRRAGNVVEVKQVIKAPEPTIRNAMWAT